MLIALDDTAAASSALKANEDLKGELSLRGILFWAELSLHLSREEADRCSNTAESGGESRLVSSAAVRGRSPVKSTNQSRTAT